MIDVLVLARASALSLFIVQRRVAVRPRRWTPQRPWSSTTTTQINTVVHPILTLVYRREYEEARRLAQSLRSSTLEDFRSLLILYRDVSDIAAAEGTIRRMKASGISPSLVEYA